jgi:alpha-L-fucosidase
MLGYKGKIRAQTGGGGMIIYPPAITPANNPSDYAWVFKLENVLSF